MSGFRSRAVIGRKIVAVELRKFSSGKRRWSFDPRLILDNGSYLRFTVDEIEGGCEYGITPILVKAKRGQNAKGQTS